MQTVRSQNLLQVTLLASGAPNGHNGMVKMPQTDRKMPPYTLLATCFVGFLLIANVAATKLFTVQIGAWHLNFDGGAILFPLTYVIGDVLAEVYGFARTRQVIIVGFVLSAVAALTFWGVQFLPPASDYAHQESFEAVLGFVPRIVAASLLGFLLGQIMNAYVLVTMKKKWGENNLWGRLLGSSIVGEALDTLVFCFIAFYGVLVGAEFWNYVLVGYIYKLSVEVLFLPGTYPLIRWARRRQQLFGSSLDIGNKNITGLIDNDEK